MKQERRVIFMIMVMFCLNLTLLFAQNINLSLSNTTVKNAIETLKKNYGYSFVFESGDVDMRKVISVKVQDQPVDAVVKQILYGQEVSYEIKEKNIIVRKAVPAPEQLVTQQQGKRITGVVADANGEPVIGVNVIEKGTGNGIISDIDGKYALEVQEGAILQVSYIGYITKEVAVGKQTTLSIQLIEDSRALEEVVVIGYGTVRKKDLTGAVSSIGQSNLQTKAVPTISEAIQGKLSGVRIQETGGNLAGRFQFSIRGTGSVTGSNDPLIVVDGIPLFNNDLSTLNPKDVASIDVLKDASASAIYGARASNGVVIITTKRGESGRPVISLNVDMGFENIAKRYELLTSEQQRRLFVEAFKNTNRNPAAFENANDPIWQINTDWQKLGIRTGIRQNYNLSINGGNEYNKYAVSGAYSKRLGIMQNSDLDEFYFRVNNDFSPSDRLKIFTNISSAYQRQNKLSHDSWGGGSYGDLVSNHSYVPAYDENHNLFGVSTAADPYFGANSNPLINLLNNINTDHSARVLGNVKVEYKIIKDLTFAANVGTDLGFVNGYQYLPVYQIGLQSRSEGSTTNSSQQTLNWITDATLQYDKRWKQNTFSILGGTSAQQYVLKNTSATGTGTIDNALDQLNNQTNFNASGASVTSTLLSTFLRLNYGFKDRYLLTGTIRRDGSSKFGSDKRYGIFPSVSAAWRISDEVFFQNVSSVNNLKLRVGYGVTGNQNIGDFAFVTRAGASPYIWGNSVVVGNSSVNMGNSRLQWESANQFNIGFDASFFKDRIDVVVDYYNKKSDDLLIQTPVPYIAAVTENPYVNLGSVQNRGIEIGLTTRNLTGKFTWTTNFNITFNKNEVLDIGKNALGEPLQIPGMTISLPNDFANLTQEGHPVGAFYMYRFIGIWQKDEAVEAALFGAVPGDPKFADINNSKSLDDGDKDFVGTPLPTYFGGLNNTFTYRAFTLNVFLNFAGGNKLYNAMRNLNARSVPFNQQLAEVADFWTEENPSNTVPQASQGGNTTFLATRVSTNFLEDAKFLRLKNLSLSYDLPKPFLEKIHVKEAVIGLNATNLITFTHYKGLNPEALSIQSLLSSGLDLTPYPPTRFYSFSLQLSF